ncbi:hypothetical protein [Parapedobacter koreensis]|uniref:Uncharacterized protein n=1 Tax=Parapedobacter koreensis TaxID=332977 RepID=A0A1H7F486_9SPHI|nr:hypothetical protein [Parapedobacter koreensis]SEK17955.1 hypothetical protein SAMN05421740_10154 [Parapedobacter koreensis]
MNNALLSILTFPQRFENGKLYFNVLLIPRNVNPLANSFGSAFPDLPAFADAEVSFTAKIIDSLDGLPAATQVTAERSPYAESSHADFRPVWEALKAQIEKSEQITVDDVGNTTEKKFEDTRDKFKNVSIKKYLPLS